LLSDDTLKKETKGVVIYNDLSRILDRDKYPADRHHCLITLMEEFQLCFKLSDSPATAFLIPGILPKSEPLHIELEDDTLDFQYHYRVLPESIISRFIVLNHEKIHNSIYWRSGVILAYREDNKSYNLACIKADPEERKIFISVNGNESTQRSFLSMIRDSFTKIHRSSFKNLESDVGEWVPVPGHPTADPLNYSELLGLERMGNRNIDIGKLGISLDLRRLLDGYDTIDSRQENQEYYYERYEHMREIALKAVGQTITNNVEVNAMSSKQENKFEHSNLSGVIAPQMSGKAQIKENTFTQNINPNVDEIIELITKLRQLSAQFPADIKEEVDINIVDVEGEAAKPEEQRSLPRLKRSLLFLGGLATSAVHLAHPIAGITEFTNTAIELAEKFHVVIPHL
jgi:internalin A